MDKVLVNLFVVLNNQFVTRLCDSCACQDDMLWTGKRKF